MLFYRINSPIGILTLAEENEALTAIIFGSTEHETGKTALLTETAKQLDAYFDGRLKHFDVPLAPRGTEFQQKVWQQLLTIPYGKTATYGEIAAQCGNPKACRAVGGANNKNPIPIIIPCHRVIGASNKLVGYAGGLDIKQKLLDIEKRCAK